MKEQKIEIPLRKATYEELQEVICELQVERYIKDKEIDRLNNIISELEKDAIELMKKYKDINAPRYDMCKHFVYKLKELNDKE